MDFRHLLWVVVVGLPLSASAVSSVSMAEKIRNLAPIPVGVVYVQQPGDDIATIRQHFRSIKELGFNCLKQIMLQNNSWPFTKRVYNTALDEGLIPWWYEKAGWLPITSELLDKLGMPHNMTQEQIQADGRMLDFQVAALRKRVDRMDQKGSPPPADGVRQGRGLLPLPGVLQSYFATWLSKEYSNNIQALHKAWHIQTDLAQPASARLPENFSAAAHMLTDTNIDTSCGYTYCQRGIDRDFRRYRDALRFEADQAVNASLQQSLFFLNHDQFEPLRIGGESGELANEAQNGWDRWLLAQNVATQAGGFYDSLHLPWHYLLTNHQNSISSAPSQRSFLVDVPVAVMVRSIVDSFRGGWTGAFESSGGPAQFSGGQASGLQAGQLQRLLLTYVAGGMKGVGLWCWCVLVCLCLNT